jgi:hypothetical protein
MFPKTQNAVVIRTDFENQDAWNAVCNMIRALIYEGEHTFYAYVDFVELRECHGAPVADLIALLPHDYEYSFFFVVDRDALANADLLILVVDLYESPGRTFRTMPTQIQCIENNLSIANMGFEEFAEATDQNGVFRGFRP